MKKLLSMLLILSLLAATPFAAVADDVDSELIAVQEDGGYEPEATVTEDDRPLFRTEEEPKSRTTEDDAPETAVVDFDAPENGDASQTGDAPQTGETLENGDATEIDLDAPENGEDTQLVEEPDEPERTLAMEAGLSLEYGPQTKEDSFDFDSDVTNDALFAGYLERIFHAGSAEARRTMATTHAGENLTGQNRVVYEALKEMILEVAEGNRSSTKFEIPLVDICGKTEFTSAELGVQIQGEPTSADYDAMDDAYFNAFSFDFSLIGEALWSDCNYELYWWKRYGGSSLQRRYPGYWIRSTQDGDLVLVMPEKSVIGFDFRVAPEYVGGDEYTVDPNLIATAKRSAENARAIVKKYAAYSDCSKLFAYAKEICALVDYNYDAIEPEWDKSRTDPWKLIWVFDGDESTKVVCEGYAHAFQYLCELSHFNSDIRCYIVSGVATGGHAWNIVRMDDGKNYLVDVTWMDGAFDYYSEKGGSLAEWMSREYGELFLCGASEGSVSGGYTVDRRKSDVVTFRTYDEHTLALYPTSVLTLARSKYIIRGFQKMEGNTYYFDQDGHYVTGTQQLNGAYYQFDSQGRLQGAPTGWQTIDGERVFFEDDGSLHTAHTEVVDFAVGATCTEDGLSEGSHCSVCGAVVVAQQVIPALGHDPVVQKGYPATSTEEGLTDGSYCGRCGVVLQAQQIIPPTGDDPVENTSDGFTYELFEDGTASITGCDLTGDVVIPETIDGHKVVNLKEKLFYGMGSITSVTIPATVTWFGDSPSDNEWDYVFSYCYDLKSINVASGNPVFRSVNGVLYSKDMETLFNYPCNRKGSSYTVPASTTWLCCTSFASSRNLNQLYLNSNEVSWATYTFYNDGALTVYYLTGDWTQERVKRAIDLGCYHAADTVWPDYQGFEGEQFVSDDDGQMHAVVTDAAIVPTCTTAGLTEGSHCSMCGRVLVAQQTVAALGHSVVNEPAVAATCTEAGRKAGGAHCARCGAVLSEAQTIPALGHDPVAGSGYAATCTKTGLTDGSYCQRCGMTLQEQETIPAKGHTAVTDKAVAATCTTAGKTAGSHCSVCNAVLTAQQTISAKGHTAVTDAAVAATCTKAGKTKGSHCSVCGTVLTAQRTVPATGHDWGEVSYTWSDDCGTVTARRVCANDAGHVEEETVSTDSWVSEDATCTAKGETTYEAYFLGQAFETQYKTVKNIPAKGHTAVTDKAVAATCTKAGKTAGSHCSVCGTVLTAQQVVAAKGHTIVTDAAVAATCTKDGKTAGSHCSVCNAVLTAQQTIPAKGHTIVTDAAVAATCTTAGKTAGSHCSVCKAVLTAQKVVPAKGHTAVTDAAVAATCTKAGKTAGSHCSVCGKVLVKQEKVPATGHTKVTDKAVAATYTKTGLTKGSHCSVCGKVLVKQEKIPKLKLPENGVLLTKNTTKTVKAGATLQIVLDGLKAKSYKSDKAVVATVSDKGLVTAELAGTAKITVKTKDGKTFVLTLKVTDTKAPKKISFVKGTAATLKKGKKLTLEVVLNPKKANYALTWSTSDKNVATVSKKGVVKAKKKGKADITVETQNGKKATITITVK